MPVVMEIANQRDVHLPLFEESPGIVLVTSGSSNIVIYATTTFSGFTNGATIGISGATSLTWSVV
jgi:hypothetical protein